MKKQIRKLARKRSGAHDKVTKLPYAITRTRKGLQLRPGLIEWETLARVVHDNCLPRNVVSASFIEPNTSSDQ